MSRALPVLGFALSLAACAIGGRAERRDWISLFDGHSLSGWRPSEFGGNGEIAVRDGRLVLGQGSPMTGITWTGEFPRDDYEIEVVAARVLGTDFFVGLTFPVGDAHLTLIVGGWGGGLCGLSCLDGMDAASNETKTFHGFERGRDFRILLRVESGRVQAWLDGAPLADVDTRLRHLSLRPEVAPSRPLGLATYATEASVRSIAWRPIDSARG